MVGKFDPHLHIRAAEREKTVVLWLTAVDRAMRGEMGRKRPLVLVLPPPPLPASSISIVLSPFSN